MKWHVLYAPDGGDGGGATDNSPEENAANLADGAEEQELQQKQRSAGHRDDGKVSMPSDKFKERLERERRAGQRELLKALGFEDVDDPAKLNEAQAALRDLVQFAQKQREEAMTAEERYQQQLEQAQTEAERMKAEAEKARQALQEMQRSLRRRAVQDALMRAAGEAKANRPEDVWAWANTFAAQDVEKLLEIDDNADVNAVDDEAVKALIERCKESRADWFRRQHPGVPSNAGARPPVPGQKVDDEAVRQQKSITRRFF